MNPNFILLKFKINYKMPIFVQVNYDKSLIVFFMNIDLLLRSVDLKYDFTPFLRILSQIGLPTGQGWVRTKRKLEQKFHDDPKSLEKFKKLNRTYQECVITGIKLHPFSKSQIVVIIMMSIGSLNPYQYLKMIIQIIILM
jgi:hypothetical protein